MKVQFTLTANHDNGKVCQFTKPLEIDLTDQACWKRVDAPGQSGFDVVGRASRVKTVEMTVCEARTAPRIAGA